MLVENNSNIVTSSQLLTLKNGESVEVLELINGQFLVLAKNGLSLYKTMASIEDPLANGLLFAEQLPADNYLISSDGRFMEAAQSGVVGLFDDKVILITPNDIQLFPNRFSALRNQDEIVRLKLG
jgi:hypothetical protein|tara:strand:- start:1668 stop:2042 length:375 start_codon:yes stop_codon:yes gene_type:complete